MSISFYGPSVHRVEGLSFEHDQVQDNHFIRVWAEAEGERVQLAVVHLAETPAEFSFGPAPWSAS